MIHSVVFHWKDAQNPDTQLQNLNNDNHSSPRVYYNSLHLSYLRFLSILVYGATDVQLARRPYTTRTLTPTAT